MKKHIIGIIILAIIIISLPLHLRFAKNNPTLAGTEPYYHARMSMQILQGIPDTDNAQNGRYTLEPYHLVSALGYLTAGPLAFNLLPTIFTITSIAFLWLLLRALKITPETQAWILLAYALSPPLLATSTIGTPQAFILTLTLAGAWLLKTKLWPAGTITLLIASTSGLAYTISSIALLAVIYLIQGKNSKRTILTIILLATLAIIGHYPPTTEIQQGIIQYFSDLGGIYGVSIFAALLALVGAVLVWKHKKTYYGAYAITILYIITSFFLPQMLIFTNILVSALAGIALAKLSQRTWKLKFLRESALLVLFCGLLFSSISQAVNLSDMPPTPEFFKALEFEPGTILTHEDYGFWIEMAGHTAIVDPLSKTDDINWDIDTIFKSTELEKTRLLLKKYNITHILITPEMKHGLIWEREQQGLDFLVENSETFKKIETGTNIGVWGVQ